MKIKGMLFIIFAACVGHIGAIDVPKSLPATIKAAEILRIAWPKQINEGKKIADEFFSLIATFPKIRTQEDYLTAFANKWKLKYKEELGFSITDYLTISVLQKKMPQIKTIGGTITITALDLQNMKINNLHGLQKIPNISTVQELNLSDNQLTTIQSKAFAGLNKLVILNLNNNKLTTILPKAFAGLTKLEYLFLNHNPLDPPAKKAIKEALPLKVDIKFK